jgi:hypothetical protein
MLVEKVLCGAQAKGTAGRDTRVMSSDGALDLKVTLSRELRATNGRGTNPEVKIPRPHWVIVATMIDMITGEELEKRELAGTAEPECDDPIKCGLAAINIGPIPAKDNRAIVQWFHCSRESV